jgi:hypothetical protein
MVTTRVLEIPADGPTVEDEASALDLIGDAFGADANVVSVPVERLSPEFFRLRSGVAGAVVQKFANYRLRLVVVGDAAHHGPRAGRSRTGCGRRTAAASCGSSPTGPSWSAGSTPRAEPRRATEIS